MVVVPQTLSLKVLVLEEVLKNREVETVLSAVVEAEEAAVGGGSIAEACATASVE